MNNHNQNNYNPNNYNQNNYNPNDQEEEREFRYWNNQEEETEDHDQNNQEAETDDYDRNNKKKGKNTILKTAFCFVGIVGILFLIAFIIIIFVKIENVNQEMNAIRDEFLAEITVSTSVKDNISNDVSSTDSYEVTSHKESTPDESTDVTSYKEFTPDESTDFSTNAPEAINFTATIANTKKSNGKQNFTSLQVFEEESEAFANAKYLSSGRYVSIRLSTNSEVKEISSKVSMHNPETDLFEDFDSCDFEVSNTVSFKIPDNPYVGYNGNFVRCIIVVSVTTEDGTFYMGCSY